MWSGSWVDGDEKSIRLVSGVGGFGGFGGTVMGVGRLYFCPCYERKCKKTGLK